MTLKLFLVIKKPGRNKYFNIWNGAKPWAAELDSFLFFRLCLRLFWGHHLFCHLFWIWWPKKKKKIIYLACWVIKYPSCPPPPSLPGWRSQPGSAFGNWHTGHFSSRSIWRAGRLPRQLCWQLLLSLSCAGAEDTPLGLPPLEDPCPVRAWALGTPWGAPVLTQNLLLLPPKCGAVNPSKAQLTPVGICACFSGYLSMFVYVFFWSPRAVYDFTYTSRW